MTCFNISRSRRRMASALLLASCLAVAAAVPAVGQSADKTAGLFDKFLWRPLGPAIMGGRTVDIDVPEGRRGTDLRGGRAERGMEIREPRHDLVSRLL